MLFEYCRPDRMMRTASPAYAIATTPRKGGTSCCSQSSISGSGNLSGAFYWHSAMVAAPRET